MSSFFFFFNGSLHGVTWFPTHSAQYHYLRSSEKEWVFVWVQPEVLHDFGSLSLVAVIFSKVVKQVTHNSGLTQRGLKFYFVK